MQEMQEIWVLSVGREDTMEEKIATHSSIFAWKFPWTEELDGLQSTTIAQNQIWLSNEVQA